MEIWQSDITSRFAKIAFFMNNAHGAYIHEKSDELKIRKKHRTDCENLFKTILRDTMRKCW